MLSGVLFMVEFAIRILVDGGNDPVTRSPGPLRPTMVIESSCSNEVAEASACVTSITIPEPFFSTQFCSVMTIVAAVGLLAMIAEMLTLRVTPLPTKVRLVYTIVEHLESADMLVVITSFDLLQITGGDA